MSEIKLMDFYIVSRKAVIIYKILDVFSAIRNSKYVLLYNKDGVLLGSLSVDSFDNKCLVSTIGNETYSITIQ